jgi:hypothetical protein
MKKLLTIPDLPQKKHELLLKIKTFDNFDKKIIKTN